MELSPEVKSFEVDVDLCTPTQTFDNLHRNVNDKELTNLTSTTTKTPEKDCPQKSSKRKLIWQKTDQKSGEQSEIKKQKPDFKYPNNKIKESLKHPLTERQQLAYLLASTVETIPHDDDEMFTKIKTRGRQGNKHVNPRVLKRNERGETALHIAAIKGDVLSLKRLLKDGADIRVKDFAGWTALHEASNHGRLEAAKLLVKHGADVNASGFEGDTPLHDAVINDHVELANFLLSRGARPHQENARRKTCADLIRSKEMNTLFKMYDVDTVFDNNHVEVNENKTKLSAPEIKSRGSERGHKRGSILGNDIQRRETQGISKMEKPIMYICKLEPSNDEVTVHTTKLMTSYVINEHRGKKRDELNHDALTMVKAETNENVEVRKPDVELNFGKDNNGKRSCVSNVKQLNIEGKENIEGLSKNKLSFQEKNDETSKNKFETNTDEKTNERSFIDFCSQNDCEEMVSQSEEKDVGVDTNNFESSKIPRTGLKSSCLDEPNFSSEVMEVVIRKTHDDYHIDDEDNGTQSIEQTLIEMSDLIHLKLDKVDDGTKVDMSDRRDNKRSESELKLEHVDDGTKVDMSDKRDIKRSECELKLENVGDSTKVDMSDKRDIKRSESDLKLENVDDGTKVDMSDKRDIKRSESELKLEYVDDGTKVDMSDKIEGRCLPPKVEGFNDVTAENDETIAVEVLSTGFLSGFAEVCVDNSFDDLPLKNNSKDDTSTIICVDDFIQSDETLSQEEIVDNFLKKENERKKTEQRLVIFNGRATKNTENSADFLLNQEGQNKRGPRNDTDLRRARDDKKLSNFTLQKDSNLTCSKSLSSRQTKQDLSCGNKSGKRRKGKSSQSMNTSSTSWRSLLNHERCQSSEIIVPGSNKFLMKTKHYELAKDWKEEKAVQLLPSLATKKQDAPEKYEDAKEHLSRKQKSEQDKLQLCLEQEIIRYYKRKAYNDRNEMEPPGACSIIQWQMMTSQQINNEKKKLEKQACASKEQFGSGIYDEIFKKYENIMRVMTIRHKHEQNALKAVFKVRI
ncbi:ankyrin repeat domain-containing protein 12-like isoform X2 [Xenia sp. Carnegie-2017]|uniref:ankyrin repeat domain-containing protein 12-like isoform X2 n=1 Tax=Xenia sp. Carnegie-2017 TaxID=2897299 RepID=UPI001F045A1E|nr:ankyrin repeat domain-containing protein 12-like isoform X2 [Xenia sp. Carnegie-2017]